MASVEQGESSVGQGLLPSEQVLTAHTRSQHLKFQDAFTHPVVTQLNSCPTNVTETPYTFWHGYKGESSTTPVDLLPYCSSRLSFLSDDPSDVRDSKVIEAHIVEEGTLMFRTDPLPFGEVAFVPNSLKTRIGAHSQSLDPGRWCNDLRTLQFQTLLPALRNKQELILSSVLQFPLNLGEETLSREYKIQQEGHEMSSDWIRDQIRDHLPALLNGNATSNSCELWLGVDNDGTVIGSYLNQDDDVHSDLHDMFSDLFPPLEQIKITEFKRSFPYRDESLVLSEFSSDAREALTDVRISKGVAWLIAKKTGKEKSYAVVLPSALAQTSFPGRTFRDWTPSQDLPSHRHVLKMTLTLNRNFAGLYVRNRVQFGRGETKGRLTAFGIWLRLRSRSSVLNCIPLFSKWNVRIRIHANSCPQTASQPWFDLELSANDILTSERRIRHLALSELLFESTSAPRVVVTDIDSWKILADLIVQDRMLHFTDDTSPTYKIVLISPVHNSEKPKGNHDTPLNKLRDCVRGLCCMQASVVEVLPSGLLETVCNDDDYGLDPIVHSVPAPSLDEVSSWMFGLEGNLRRRSVLPGLIEHEFVVVTADCVALQTRVLNELQTMNGSQGTRRTIYVTGERSGSGVTTAMKIVEHRLKQSSIPVVDYLFVESEHDMVYAKRRIQRCKDRTFVVFVDLPDSADFESFLARSTSGCSFLAVINSGYRRPQDAIPIHLKWSRKDLNHLVVILKDLPFSTCSDFNTRARALQLALDHVQKSEFFFVFHLAASRGEYKDAQDWVLDQIDKAREHFLVDKLNAIAFIQMVGSRMIVDQNWYEVLRKVGDILKFAKLGSSFRVTFIHPELARLFLHSSLPSLGFSRSFLFPHPHSVLQLLTNQVKTYLLDLMALQRHEAVLLVRAMFISRGATQKLSHLLLHFVENPAGYLVEGVVRYPLVELVTFMTESIDSRIWSD